MQKDIFVARQPILNGNNELFAYELLYRDIDNDNHISDNRAATASVLVHTLNQFDISQILGPTPAFIKVDSAFLMQDMIYSIPKDQFVLALFQESVLSGPIIERISHFHKNGWSFAVNDSTLDHTIIANFQPILEYLSYWKIDTQSTDLQELNIQSLIHHLRDHSVACIATKVETLKVFHHCKEMGFDYFQGYYFSRPRLLTNRIFDAEQATVMKLWNLIMSDVPVKEISAAFEETPTLCAQLLNYINSAAFHFKAPIQSITQVLMLLGRMPLMQWLLLTINARTMASPKQQIPLQILLINRIEIMLGLFHLIKHHGNVDTHHVHFVGLLSFIDILLGIPLSTVLEQLNVDATISEALIEQKGLLGDLLQAARAIEHFDMDAMSSFLETYDISADDVITLTMKTIEKVNAFEESL